MAYGVQVGFDDSSGIKIYESKTFCFSLVLVMLPNISNE